MRPWRPMCGPPGTRLERFMTVTAKLLRVFRVDQQLRGLKSRLNAAERFLAEQQRLLAEIDAKHQASQSLAKQLKVGVSTDEHEAAAVEARMAALREQMNAARTNKEYAAFLSELNALKARKDEAEKSELEKMESLQKAELELTGTDSKRDERVKIVAKAQAERDERATDVPKDALKAYEDLSRLREDETMAQIEVLDHRAHEYTCSSCQMTLPVETLNHVVKGNFVRCSACQCILFSDEEIEIHKKPTPKAKKAKASAPESV